MKTNHANHILYFFEIGLLEYSLQLSSCAIESSQILSLMKKAVNYSFNSVKKKTDSLTFTLMIILLDSTAVKNYDCILSLQK
jgi:hypothetical protein